ncbi:long chain fatty alcohol oxidase [Biscogniauxia sp. FL1348]|nr:long chain fatty alcohol oxidase [Biscogniauxia sp. FL1348]
MKEVMTTPTDQPQPPAHIAVPLPPQPDTSFFSETQWRVWFALLDAAVPGIVSEAGTAGKERDAYRISADVLNTHFAAAKASVATPAPLSRAEFEDYLAERVMDTPAFRESVARTMSSIVPDLRKTLGKMLSLLGTSWGSVALTGHRRPFYALTANQREAVLRAWLTSPLQAFRLFAKTVTTLAKKAYVQTSPQWGRLGGWTDLPTVGWPPARPPPVGYVFKQFATESEEPIVLDTDVVVVGSGCGGAVAAKVLAEAGHRVLVVDKGYYFPPEMLPMPSSVAEAHLFENGGSIPTDDGALNIVAGSTWGGGGTVNWGVSLQAPDYVLQEWAVRDGLPFFATPAFQDSFARVCDFMGVSAASVRQNHRGRALLEGAARLGLDARPTPHNSGGDDTVHECGHCHLGCGSSGKQGPAVSWLPAAARAGAEFIEGFQVERVVFDDDDDAYVGKTKKDRKKKGKNKRRATGVVGTWVSRDKDGGVRGGPEERVTRNVVVRAKRVVVACGTLRSPILLMKSGLKNPHIGKNLHLHPVNAVSGFWKEEVRPWEGCAITSVCTSLENLDNNGHGVKLEPMSMVPLLVHSNLPWRGALDFKLTALRYRHMGLFFSMARDRDTGRVYPDRTTGKPRVAYTPSAFDRAHALEGVVALARICYAAGAEEIRPFLPGIEPFLVQQPGDGDGDRDGDKDKDFQAWLRRVRAAGNSTTAAWGSAHQMGSCRMGRSEKAGVVDARGAVWEVEGLYVADASVFPSASGVNPMVTVMAIADWIARGMVEELKEEGTKSRL